MKTLRQFCSATFICPFVRVTASLVVFNECCVREGIAIIRSIIMHINHIGRIPPCLIREHIRIAVLVVLAGRDQQVVVEKVLAGDHSDEVKHKGKVLRPEKMVYLLLNKPKGFITTTDDPYERKTVMSLVEKACPERIIPVGRLDRNTTGLLLFTNDGDLAKKLTHPKYNIKKIYHVVLDKALSKQDITTIAEGIKLDDGLIKVDAIAYAEDGIDKNQIGIELHSGKNRIVRRIFEHLEYKVSRLDRVSFAGLTKKDTPRGKWRFLKEFEISRLKMLG